MFPGLFGTFDGTPPLWPKVPATPQERKLSGAMIGYWTSFARTGKPQAASEPDWPAFGTTGSYMAFEDAPKPSEHLLPGKYELIEETVCRRRARQVRKLAEESLRSYKLLSKFDFRRGCLEMT